MDGAYPGPRLQLVFLCTVQFASVILLLSNEVYNIAYICDPL